MRVSFFLRVGGSVQREVPPPMVIATRQSSHHTFKNHSYVTDKLPKGDVVACNSGVDVLAK